MTAAPNPAHDLNARAPDSTEGRPRGFHGLVVALLSALCVLALPTATAFGEGSVDVNTGPGGATRQGLSAIDAAVLGQGYTVLYVYAGAGETIQMGSSATTGSSNILVYAPGTDLESLNFPEDPAFGTDVFDCDTNDPGTGAITTRAQELAGPLPNAGGYTPCEFVAPAAGIYPVIMVPSDPCGSNDLAGTVNAPVQPAGSQTIAMWDITVRNAVGAVQPGRMFSNGYWFRSPFPASEGETGGGAQVFAYTKTGYEYQVDFAGQSGGNWTLASDDLGVIDAATGERLFASFDCDKNNDNSCEDFRATLAPPERRHALFVNRVDPVVISGPGGLAGTRDFAAAPISPASNPLGSSFTGADGAPNTTSRGEGGTINFTSPTQMAGSGYTLAIDMDGNGVFGDDSDVVDTGELGADGTSSFAWNGLNAAGNAPACGNYQYQVRAPLSEVHFALNDVESSGGTRIERLSLPGDPLLGDPLAASYNDIDPFTGTATSNASPPAVTNGTSGPGFHAWDGASGNGAYEDTWVRLPEVQTTGTLQVLCPDVEIVKSTTAPLVAGERGTYRLTMINHGPGTAINAKSSDDLPSGVTFVSASDGCSQAAGVVTCTEPSLAEGASKTFTVTVDVDSSADSCEDVRNTATVENETGPDPEPSNNTSTICNLERRADLSLSKAASSATVARGGQVMYTMVVRNRGPSDEPNAVVKDPVPVGLTLVSAEPAQGRCSTANNTLECDLGSLVAGGSTQILVTATLSGGECVTNRARVGGDAFDPNLANNVDEARVCPEDAPPPRFDLVVSKSVNKKNPLVGETVRYRVVVTNRGPDAAPSVTVKDTLNAPVDVVSVKASQGSCTKRIPMTCELGTIPAGGRVTITIRARHLKPASGDCSRRGQRNAASATGDGTDTNPDNNLDVVRVCPKVGLQLTKKVSVGTVRAGQAFSYTIRVHNPSKVGVRNVRTCDRLPAGLAYVSSNPKARLSRGEHCWTARSIGAGKSKNYKVTVRALSGASGRLLNTASASSPDTRTRRVRRPVQVIGQAVEPPQPTG